MDSLAKWLCWLATTTLSFEAKMTLTLALLYHLLGRKKIRRCVCFCTFAGNCPGRADYYLPPRQGAAVAARNRALQFTYKNRSKHSYVHSIRF